MNIKDVYEKFEKLHSYSFATLDGNYPEIRIAHFLTYDESGLYFQTMKVKPFYRQLKESKKLAVCALISKDIESKKNEKGLSLFPPGFFIRISGDVKELDNAELAKKAKKNPNFIPLQTDIERYPTMTSFVLYRFKGEYYDYDYAKQHRDHKIERTRFSFGGMPYIEAGFHIDENKCIACDNCAKVCTFSAIIPGKTYSINPKRCDECGSCYTACPVNAITAKTPLDEKDRTECGKKIIAYAKKQRINK